MFFMLMGIVLGVFGAYWYYRTYLYTPAYLLTPEQERIRRELLAHEHELRTATSQLSLGLHADLSQLTTLHREQQGHFRSGVEDILKHLLDIQQTSLALAALPEEFHGVFATALKVIEMLNREMGLLYQSLSHSNEKLKVTETQLAGSRKTLDALLEKLSGTQALLDLKLAQMNFKISEDDLAYLSRLSEERTLMNEHIDVMNKSLVDLTQGLEDSLARNQSLQEEIVGLKREITRLNRDIAEQGDAPVDHLRSFSFK